MSLVTRQATLHLCDPVRVCANGNVLPVRRKGLAMLAYLALEGSTRRERLADVLWDARGTRQNLRVELHRLRASFASSGIAPLASGGDPLALGSQIAVAPISSHRSLLWGLEDVSSEYQAWLEVRRAAEIHDPTGEARGALLDDLARHIAPPFVLVLQGVPGSGRRTLARALARRLGLPFAEGARGEHAAVRYLPADAPAPDALADRVARDLRSVWVVGLSAFSKDPPLLMRLRASIDADLMRFERLRALTWPEVLQVLPTGLGFDEAARMYLASAGVPGHLNELLRLRSNAPLGPIVPVPQKARAAVNLEAHRLSVKARAALERLSLHSGAMSLELLEVIDAVDHVDELESAGWLTYDGRAWQHSEPHATRMLRESVQPGTRLRLHQLIAQHFDHLGDRAAANQHRFAMMVLTNVKCESANVSLAPEDHGAWDDWGSTPRRRTVPGRELWLDEPRLEGEGLSTEGERVTWWRLPPARGADSVSWALPPEGSLIRVAGRAQLSGHDDLIGASDPIVLRMSLWARRKVEVAFAHAAAPDAGAPETLIVPVGGQFEHWFAIDRGGELRLACDAPAAVIEVTVEVFETRTACDAGEEAVDAIDLISDRSDALESTRGAPNSPADRTN